MLRIQELQVSGIAMFIQLLCNLMHRLITDGRQEVQLEITGRKLMKLGIQMERILKVI